MGGEIKVVQGVRVLDVLSRGDDVYVDIYGGPSNVCGSLRFTVAARRRRRAEVRLLRRWRDADTALTYVSSGSSFALQHDGEVYGAQLRSISAQ